MAEEKSFFELWPARAPRSLPPPETSVFDDLAASARRYPNRAAIPYFGTEMS